MTLTVGQLIEALGQYDEAREVVMSSGMSFYHISGVFSFEPQGAIVLATHDWHSLFRESERGVSAE